MHLKTKCCDIASKCVLVFNCSVSDAVRKKLKLLNKLKYLENIVFFVITVFTVNFS